MRQVIYPTGTFRRTELKTGSTFEIGRIAGGVYSFISKYDTKGPEVVITLTPDDALRVAGYILSTHPEGPSSSSFSGLGFAKPSASCEDLPSPEFVVMSPVRGAEHIDPLQYRAEVNRRLLAAFSDTAKAVNDVPASANSETPAADEPEDVGPMTANQVRRVAALKAAKDLAPDGLPEETLAFAAWIYDGLLEATEGGEQA